MGLYRFFRLARTFYFYNFFLYRPDLIYFLYMGLTCQTIKSIPRMRPLLLETVDRQV